ncbi:GyrI-like domain-containing protein [Stappia sp. 28M-7]|uniref:GyrI-like domain-containing protein n=1 Tax=Stappia sp. 28M-7 TaxID=2762596 RepID=UPI00163BB277|nr:GyrI-like domain-containing protein [Stappia sp. 28M-7]MBC2859458.1 GyrI-like domain-containing protein [Stappia sp. 28M-7]
MVDEALIDLTQDRATLRRVYAPPAGDFSRVDVPRLPFATLDGEGPPEQTSIEAAVKVLYTAIYAIRREARKLMGKSFVEPPVEILYWADDMRDLAAGNREKWQWRVQITLPVWADAQKLKDSAAEARHELGDEPAVRWEVLAEGECVQVLHVGETDDLPEILAGLYGDHLPEQGLEADGPYHEIYLDDWSRVAPQRRKIILRQPVRPTQ